MLNNKINLGDTVSIFLYDELIAKGVVWINAPIPISRFYHKVYGIKPVSGINEVDDIYESALVIKDEKNYDKLYVLTMENEEYKFFVWNDLVSQDSNFDYKIIRRTDSIKIVNDNVILTEMKF